MYFVKEKDKEKLSEKQPDTRKNRQVILTSANISGGITEKLKQENAGLLKE